MVNPLGAKSSFLRVELPFYKALTITRKYGTTKTNTVNAE